MNTAEKIKQLFMEPCESGSPAMHARDEKLAAVLELGDRTQNVAAIELFKVGAALTGLDDPKRVIETVQRAGGVGEMALMAEADRQAVRAVLEIAERDHMALCRAYVNLVENGETSEKELQAANRFLDQASSGGE